MSGLPGVNHDELLRIPLLRGFTGPQLDAILALCEPVSLKGQVLFREGDTADAFYLLTRGIVALSKNGEEIHTLHPVAIIGELGAITGRMRVTTAVLGPAPSEVWKIPVAAMRELCFRDPELGLRFHQNLLGVVADKVLRDQIRLHDMRSNLIRTQKDMKQVRDYLLESDDTQVSARVHRVLEQNIERNRRVHYRVEPPDTLEARMRLGDGSDIRVAQVSREHIKLEAVVGSLEERISGVLVLCGPEIPVSGKVVKQRDGHTEIALDFLIDEYAVLLEGYLTRVQMLDLLV